MRARALFARIIPIVALLMLCQAGLSACGGNKDQPNESELVTDGNDVLFKSDFDVVGGSAHTLIKALDKKGIKRGREGSDKKIIVGNSSEELSVSAQQKLDSRKNNYNDFVILCNGEQVALCGGSQYALLQCIGMLTDRLYDNAVEGFVFTESFEYYYHPITSVEMIGGVQISSVTVVGEGSAISAAEALAHELSVLSGYGVPFSRKAVEDAYMLTVTADGSSELSFDYTVERKDGGLFIKACSAIALSSVVKDFVKHIPEISSENGDCMEFTVNFNIKKASDTELFKYCGMWQATDSDALDTMVSYWGGASVEVDFAGESLELVFSSASKCRIQLDGEDYTDGEISVSGIYMVTAEIDGKHTVRVFTDDRESHIHFAGVNCAESVELSKTASKEHYIQFVGDSISDTVSSFSYRVGPKLGWDYCVTAVSGMALENNLGFWYLNNGSHADGTMSAMIKDNFGIRTIGMETAFFKLGIAQENMVDKERELYGNKYYTDDLNCSFNTGYTPDIVFIFLGTNDELNSLNDEKRFSDAYLRLVEGIFDVYGSDTQICILQALTHAGAEPNEAHPRFECIRRTANTIIGKYPNNVRFIDRDEILKWDVEISGDYTHPTLNGYDTLTEKISELLDTYY